MCESRINSAAEQCCDENQSNAIPKSAFPPYTQAPQSVNCSLTSPTALSLTVCQMCPRKARINILQLLFLIQSTINARAAPPGSYIDLQRGFPFFFFYCAAQNKMQRHTTRGPLNSHSSRQHNSLNQTLLFIFLCCGG